MTNQYDPREPWQPAPTNLAPAPTPQNPDGLAVTSLVLGILGLVSNPVLFCICAPVGFPLPLVGLCCGLLSKHRGPVRTAGIICSAVALLLAVVGLGLMIFGMLVSPQWRSTP